MGERESESEVEGKEVEGLSLVTLHERFFCVCVEMLCMRERDCVCVCVCVRLCVTRLSCIYFCFSC